jgi:hypothetical protein
MAQAFEEKEGAVNSWFALSYCIIIQVVCISFHRLTIIRTYVQYRTVRKSPTVALRSQQRRTHTTTTYDNDRKTDRWTSIAQTGRCPVLGVIVNCRTPPACSTPAGSDPTMTEHGVCPMASRPFAFFTNTERNLLHLYLLYCICTVPRTYCIRII